MKSNLFAYVMRWKGQHLANAPRVTWSRSDCGAPRACVIPILVENPDNAALIRKLFRMVGDRFYSASQPSRESGRPNLSLVATEVLP